LLRSLKRLEGLVIAALLAIVVFGVAAPRVLGMTAPSKLVRSTTPAHTIRVTNVAPGDSFSKRIDFHNYTSRPLDYRVVFIRRGELWRCDRGGNSLFYEVEWSPGADQHLGPGETETARITVRFPLAAGNECQGDIGRLIVRRGFIEGSDKGGVYECRAMSVLAYGVEILDADDSLDRHLCWEQGKVLHSLLRH